MKNRREFLKLLGLAVGASLTGCGNSNDFNFGPTSLANGYAFFPLASQGQALPNRRSILAQAASEDELPFLGAVMLNDLRHVCFHVNDEAGRHGVYEVDYDLAGNLAPIKHIVSEGDVLEDGTVVEDVSGGYLNNDDDLVFVISSENASETLLYAQKGGPLKELFEEYDNVSDECRLYGDLRPEVGLSDDGDLLFVSNYRDDQDNVMGEGLFLLPKETASGTSLLLAENQLLPGTNCIIRTFGLCEITRSGNYLVQGTASPVEGQTANSTTKSFLAYGMIGQEPEILVAHPSLGIGGAIQGSVFVGPRLGPDGYAYVVQTSSERSQLYLNKTKLLDGAIDGSGSLTPRGSRIVSFFPPVFGPEGLLMIQVFTTTGSEILAYSKGSFSTVLSQGDIISGNEVAAIMFGCLAHSVNVHGELAAVVEYTSGESAVVLGIPV